MVKKTIPAISIVIPMYNAEKYVGECLDSILAQTFTDYEIIVVDNCSTDNSTKIVESYVKKFTNGGRLQLVRRNVNSGSGAIPKNTGLRYSHGEYIFFMDSDDAITPNALEVLFNAAEKFNADVVHCEEWFVASEEIGAINKKIFPTNSWSQKKFIVDKPTFMTKDINQRIQEFVKYRFGWTYWLDLIRRDLIIKNNLEFPNLINSEDVLYSFYLLALAENIIYIPDVLYFWRTLSDSLTHQSLDAGALVHKKVYDIFNGIQILDDFTKKFGLFQNQPQYKYMVMDFFTLLQMYQLLPVYSQIPAFQLDSLIRREIEQLDDSAALTAFLFARMNIFNVNLLQQQNLIRQQQAQIQQLQAQLQQLQSNNTQGFSNFHVNTEDIFNM